MSKTFYGIKVDEEMEQAVSRETPCEAREEVKKESFWKKHQAEIIAGSYYGVVLLLTCLGVRKSIKNCKLFDNQIKSKYGQNVTEGCMLNKSLKEMWDGNRKFEEEYKGNFDKVADFVKGLDMRSDELYTIEKCVDKSGKLVTALTQTRDGGWYHGITL